MSAPPVIACIRETNRLTDALVASYVAAQQVQVSRDFAPAWGVDATCVFVPPGGPIPVGAWCLYLQDHVAQAGCYGFHSDDGAPKAYVAVADTLADGCSWTVTASHEWLEMLGDQTCARVVDVAGQEYAVEVCDACEDDRFSYPVTGHHLSAFVLPAWFDPAGVAPFTFPPIASIAAPFALAEGGYIGVRSLPDGQWSQRLADGVPGRRTVKAATSRTMRRFAA
jgi:hypothetical protein